MKIADGTASIDTAALRALLDKGTPGRWIAGAAREDGTAQVYCPNRGPMRVIVPVAETEPNNAALIAALRNAAPALLYAADERVAMIDANDRLRADNAALRAALVILAEHEPSWPDDFCRARAVLAATGDEAVSAPVDTARVEPVTTADACAHCGHPAAMHIDETGECDAWVTDPRLPGDPRAGTVCRCTKFRERP